MGEKEFEQKMLVKAVTDATQGMMQSSEALRLSTPGGRFHVRWDEGGSATAMGQLAFFAEFLETTVSINIQNFPPINIQKFPAGNCTI